MTRARIHRPRIENSAPLAALALLLLLSPAGAQAVPPDPRFGAVEAFRDPGAAAEAGVGWERILFYWSELQPGGPDDWNGYHVRDEWLTQAASGGREVVVVLKHTPAWATDGLPGCGVPRGLQLPVDDPGNLWARFVRRVVQLYAGRINRWIVWNEPDITPDTYGAEWCGSVEEYYQLLKVAYVAARQANPEARIHLAGMTFHHDEGYLGNLLDVALQDATAPANDHYFDAATVHIYFQTESVPLILSKTRAAMDARGLGKPIWVNETNASPNGDPEWPLVRPCWQVNLEEQASFLLQSFSLALATGAERVAVYKWLDNISPGEEPFGVLRPDHSRRPAFDAYRLITIHYAGTVAAYKDRQALHTVVALDRGGLTTRVLWARTQAGAAVSLHALAPQARLIHQAGGEQTIEPVDGRYSLTLPGARCPEEPPECLVAHPPCIIGGATYLLVEQAPYAPPPQPTPQPTEVPTAASPLDTPTPPPTEAPTATSTTPPTETPTSTPTPTNTALPPTPTPTPSATPLPSPTPRPPLPTTPSEPIWPMLLGLALVLFFAALVGTMFRHQS